MMSRLLYIPRGAHATPVACHCATQGDAAGPDQSRSDSLPVSVMVATYLTLIALMCGQVPASPEMRYDEVTTKRRGIGGRPAGKFWYPTWLACFKKMKSSVAANPIELCTSVISLVGPTIVAQPAVKWYCAVPTVSPAATTCRAPAPDAKKIGSKRSVGERSSDSVNSSTAAMHVP